MEIHKVKCRNEEEKTMFGKFDCWISWKSGKTTRIPLDIPAIQYYRERGVEVTVVGEYKYE